MTKLVNDADFIRTWKSCGSPAEVARRVGLDVRSVYKRRESLARKGVALETTTQNHNTGSVPVLKFERRRELTIKNGHAVIFSDAHFYPGEPSTSCLALLSVLAELKPAVTICNGDALDGTQISRHDPTRGWHQPPSLREQLDSMIEQMDAIKHAAGKRCDTYMTLGNHDARLSRYLAVNAPHMENLPGTRLEDYIPAWPLSWTLAINGNTIIRHRHLSGGVHSSYQSPLRAGTHFVHGHLHNLNVRILPKYQGFLYGVDTGSLADPQSDAFDYAEDGIPHVQGFAVLTFKDGELLMPELCYVQGGQAYFRGQAI